MEYLMRYRWLLLVILVVGPLACDEANPVPPEVLNKARANQNIPETKPAPTTQQLLSGAKKTLRLGTFPLSVQVPNDWELKSEDGLIAFGGPASSGDITVQLVQQAAAPGKSISASSLDQLLPKFKAEAVAKPHPVNRVEIRELPAGVKLLEQRMISNEFVAGKLPPEQWGETVISPGLTTRAIINPHIVKWNLTVFIPLSKDQYETRGLNFLGLKLSEYERDKQFLEQIVDSLKYEGN